MIQNYFFVISGITETDETYEQSTLYEKSNLEIPPNESMAKYEDTLLLVQFSQLKLLMRFCYKCGKPVDTDETKVYERTGSQLTVTMCCLGGCDFTWSSQSKCEALKGSCNLDPTCAITFAGTKYFYYVAVILSYITILFFISFDRFLGIPFAKFERMASILKLKSIDESTMYRLRKDYVAPVIDEMWQQERKQVSGNLIS